MAKLRKWMVVALVFLLTFGALPALSLGGSRADAASTSTIVTLNSDYGKVTISDYGWLSLSNSGAAQTFVMTDLGDGNVSLRSQSNDQYVSVVSDWYGNTYLMASSSSVHSTETFKKVSAGSGKYMLQSASNNKYWSWTSAGYFSIVQASAASSSSALKLTIEDASTPTTPEPADMPVNILEITDDGQSDLTSIFRSYSSADIHIDSMRMKTFVARRDELDGRYDAIYIAKGAYSAKMVGSPDQNHDTSGIMNDITHLKMQEIQDYYIDKGLPVIVYSQASKNSRGTVSSTGALYQNQAGILKSSFAAYATIKSNPSTYPYVPTSNKDNVIFVGDSNIDTATHFLAKTNLLTSAAARPRLVLTGQPVDYTKNTNQIYKAGDTITFTFDVANADKIEQRSLVANLYIGIDQVIKFDASNLVASQPVSAANGNQLVFRLPKGYSGLHYWKLELVDQGSKLKDISTGVFRFRDELTKINVLQVLPNNGDASSLKKDSNLNQSYLKTSDYNISITTTSIDSFNNGGYKNLNGYYDMLIFGFVDEYNKLAPISATAAAAVNTFIATGQSVMFTHDTVFQGNMNWINYFQDATGQISPMTNMGLNAKYPSTTTKKVNDGLLTQFPFNIGVLVPKVNTTHDQYFGLKLEDPNLIPWYNITGDPRDEDDSWNHYYTYSYGNVTYSGTGHTNTKFPDWEQQLFVNTMYRAFIGSNHAPIVTVDTPTNTADTGQIIPSYNKILLNYTAQDYDLLDRTLSTAVTFKYRKSSSDDWKQLQVKPYTEGNTGDTLTESYDNPLPDGGELMIYVTAKDSSGATATQTITTTVVKVTANVDLSRTLSDNVKSNQIDNNVPFTMTYTITPKSIPYKNGIDASDLVIRNFKLDEQLPPNLEVLAGDVSSLVTNPVITGSLAAGYRLTGTLPDIQYRRDSNAFVADPVTFTVKVTPRQSGNYLVQNSTLSFTDFYVNGTTVTKDIARSLQFQPFAIQAVTKMASLSLPDAVIAKGDESILTPVIGPDDTTNKTLEWSSDRPDLVTVTRSGVIKGVAEGKARITARATDGSGLTAVSNVTVVVPGINIVGPNTVNVDDTIYLEAKPILANETLTSIRWEISSGQSNGDLGAGTNDLKRTLTGVNAGQVAITVTVTTDKGKTYTKTFTVNVIQPVQLSLPGEIHIGVGEEWQRDLWGTALTVTPAEVRSGIQSYTKWTSSNEQAVSVGSDNGVAVGAAAGVANVTASYQHNPKTNPVTATVRVVAVDLKAPEQVTIAKGGQLDLRSLVNALPAASSSAVLNGLTWGVMDDKDFASVSGSGLLTGLAPGTETVTLTYRQTADGPVVISKTVQVNVVDLSVTDASIPIGLTVDLDDLVQVLPSSLADEVKGHLAWADDAANDVLTLDASDAGSATGNKVGTETVTAIYTPSDGSPPIRIEVPIRVEAVGLTLPPTWTIAAGRSYSLWDRLGITPPSWADSIKAYIEWLDTPDNRAVDLLTGGKLSGKQAGSETVEARYANPNVAGDQQASASMKVKVVDLSFDEPISIGQGESQPLAPYLDVSPSEMRANILEHVTWSDESGKDYLSVNKDSGVATGKSAGTETVTVTYTPSDGDPIVVTVQVTVTDVDLGGPTSKTVKLGSTVNFMTDAQLAKQPASVKDHLYWSIDSSNKSTLSSSGVLTADKAGTAKVTVTYRMSAGGAAIASRVFTVNIVDLQLPESVVLNSGQVFNLLSSSAAPGSKLTISPSSGALYEQVKSGLVWSDEAGKSYVSVSKSGILTAGVNSGNSPVTETITVTYTPSDGPAITDSVLVKVRPSATGHTGNGDKY